MKPVKLAIGAAAVLGLAVLQPWAAQPQGQVSTLFRTDFNNANAGGTNNYGFVGRYPVSSTTWEHSHLATGGWNGSGAPHVVVHGCPGGGCSMGSHQYNVGWYTGNSGRTFTIGESAFIRFRIKFDPNTQFPVGQFGAKFILWGNTGTSPNSRWIIHLFAAQANGGCSLGFPSYSSMGWTPPASTWVTEAQFGTPSFSGGGYAGFVNNVNIGWSCNPAVLVTRSNHPAPVPKPQNIGAAATDGWYHLQFQATTGNNGQADFRSWANNNSQSSPSSEHLNMPDGLGVEEWDGGINVGGFWGTAQPGDIGFVIDDFEVGMAFDPNWYPGGGSGPGPVNPVTPTGVRIVSP
jgi:hypothetical protein